MPTKRSSRMTADDVRGYLRTSKPAICRLLFHKRYPLPFTMSVRDLNVWIKASTVKPKRGRS